MTKPGRRQRGQDDPSDGVLVKRSLDGDQGAFGDLVRRYERLVFKIVGGFLRNPADVEEVSQEAFIRAFEGLSTFRQDAPFAPWIVRIATRVSYDRLRSQRRTQEIAWEELGPGEQRTVQELVSGGEAEDRAAARDLAERALACLSPKDRQVVMLTQIQGSTTTEVAETMGCSALAVRLRLHRGRRAMRQVLETLLREMNHGE